MTIIGRFQEAFSVIFGTDFYICIRLKKHLLLKRRGVESKGYA